MSKAAFLLKYGNAKHISDVLHDNNKFHDYRSEDIGHAIEHNPYWNENHTKKIIHDDWYHLNSKALAHHSTTPEMLHDAIDSGDYSLMHAAAIHPNTTEEHHLKIIHGDPRFTVDMLQNHQGISDKIFEECAKSPHKSVRMAVSDHPHAPDHVIHQLVSDPDERIAKYAKSEWDTRTMADSFK